MDGGLALRRLKYQGATWLAPDLVDWLTACWQTEYDLLPFDGVCYVPLHAVHQRERGFNQAALLASLLARRKDRPLINGALIRTVRTSTQTRLTASQRASNVRGVFAVRRPGRVRDKRLLLVDDVMTTGATTSECARVLKRSGAAAVEVFTPVRSVP